ncbi:MAG: HEAT repeat domain-containing protein [Myxococcaceae bacterium]|nr:HEAT repeat domain-containing protein [Myxococcaceae bacterium]MCA3013040.1 HEAT repeat domain-containing protein [Myxococcaceae bacterium]
MRPRAESWSLLVALAVAASGCRDSAYRAASKVDSIAAWRQFVAQHPTDEQLDAARARLAELEFAEARTVHTVVAYKRFLEAHPDSAQARAAKALLEALRFNAAREQGTAQALRQFIREHPEGVHRDEADALLRPLELKEVAKLDEPVMLARIAAQNPEDPRAAEVSSRLDEVAFSRATTAETQLAYLRDFPAGAHRDEVKARLLSVQLDGLLVSGAIDEAAALAARSPLGASLGDWPARLAKARALAALEATKDPLRRRALPGWTRRALPDVLASLRAADPMDRWQAVAELGQFVSVKVLDPLLEQLRAARHVLVRQAAFDGLRAVVRLLPRHVAEYELATRLEALAEKAQDGGLVLTRAALLDVSGQLERAAQEYQRAWDASAPDPVVLRRWVALRAERRQHFASAATARQLAAWAKDAATQAEPPTPATALFVARELCAARQAATLARDAIAAARREGADFPEDLEAFEVRAVEAQRLVEARLRDAELVLLEEDARARRCGDDAVAERIAAGEAERLEALATLGARPPKEWPQWVELVRWRDPSPRVRASVK